MDNATHGRPQGQRTRTGFTLIELLVVVSIIALLLGILLPSLAGAREAANGLVCQANLRSIGTAQQTYISDNRGQLAGSPGTTGRALLNDPRALDPNAEEVHGLATQPFDWAGPLGFDYMSDGGGIPNKRSDRFVLLNGTKGRADPLSRGGPLEMLACPSQRLIASPFVAGSIQPAGTDEFPVTLASSYASTRDILWGSGPLPNGTVPTPEWARPGFWGASEDGVYAPTRQIASSWQLPGLSGYRPLIANLASPSSKIFVYDGTRFQRADLRVIDHDTDASAGFGGAFSDLGGWDLGNTRTLPTGRNAIGQNMSGISFRHGVGGIDERGEGGGNLIGNAVYYDGHVGRLNLDEARRPDPWLPSGALINPARLATVQLQNEYRQRLESGRIPMFRIP